MRHFYKLVEGVQLIPLMTALMEQQELFRSGDALAEAIVLHDRNGDSDAMRKLGAKKIILSVMQLSEGTELGNVGIIRLGHGGKLMQEPLDYSRFYVVLQGLDRAMLTAGDETITLRTGEVWWVDTKQERIIMNNSLDDLLLMQIDIRIDR